MTHLPGLSILFEVDSGDCRAGAVVEILDLAQGLSARGIQCHIAGVLTPEFEHRAREVGASIIHWRSRMFARLGIVPYAANTLVWMARLRQVRPSVVHVNYATWGASLACAAHRMGIPVVGRAVAGYHPKNPSNRWISAYVANSPAHASGLRDTPLSAKVHVARTVIRLDRRPDGNSLTHPVPPKRAGRVRFLFLGQLVERKGIDYLLHAAARSPAEAEFLLVGGDWSDSRYPHELRALIGDLGLSDRVLLLNHRSDIEALMLSADVFVLPSLSEARPRSIIEAMFMGLPIVATKVGAIPTLVADNENGLLVSPASADELAAAIEKLCRSREMRSEFGMASRAKAEVELDANGAVEEHLKIYRYVLGGPILKS